MSKHTQQQIFAAGLFAMNYAEVLPSHTSKARTFRKPGIDGQFFYLGKAGSFRYGRNYTSSRAVPSRLSYYNPLTPPLPYNFIMLVAALRVNARLPHNGEKALAPVSIDLTDISF